MRATRTREPIATEAERLDDSPAALFDLLHDEAYVVELAPGFELMLALPRFRSKVKRAIDLVLGSVAVVFAAPIVALVALAIKLDSPGPVFFRQDRVGRGGRHFKVFKFRTMEAGASERLAADPTLAKIYEHNHFKIPAHVDKRVTRLGRFLRRTSLDELPQLFNVLRGEMSLVGPRPVVPDEVLKYGPLQPAYMAVRPGITGEWQVRGRSEIGYPTRAVIDFIYVHRWGLIHDFLILVRTVPAVLTRRGAY
ncbi:MAG TPA: sugar transferase [Acidimicrobiales bacterium]|nr:sugar transferase [Acidimicrobiales bacterium]